MHNIYCSISYEYVLKSPWNIFDVLVSLML